MTPPSTSVWLDFFLAGFFSCAGPRISTYGCGGRGMPSTRGTENRRCWAVSRLPGSEHAIYDTKKLAFQ